VLLTVAIKFHVSQQKMIFIILLVAVKRHPFAHCVTVYWHFIFMWPYSD